MKSPDPAPPDGGHARRARPLLGTLVEIAADAPPAVFTRAFAAVEKVQALMSYHDPASELSRLNREASAGPVSVSAWTGEVLRAALDLAAETEGVFDPTVAPRLTALGFLPPTAGAPRADGRATWRDVELASRNRVRFRRPLRLELGGIAKGFAVDRAVEVLQKAGVAEGMVNAGGDLRVFGSVEWPVEIRHPGQPGLSAASVPVCNAAMATSAGYFARRRHAGKDVTALLDGRTRQPLDPDTSVSVMAPTALLADALTKVVFALGPASETLLQRHGASALVLDSHGFRAIPPILPHAT